MFDISTGQFDLVYNALSFTFACMVATTIFCWLRVPSVAEQFKSALVITGLVTFIASYHYLRIFNSWNTAYTFAVPTDKNPDGSWAIPAPTLTGVGFNDAYRYMDWLLTVPLLLVEIVLVMRLSEEETFSKGLKLGAAAALMIIVGYPGELLLDSADLPRRWLFWAAAMLPFLYIVYTLLYGLGEALQSESNDRVRHLIWLAQRMTIVSWLTYPIVYTIPMMGLSGSSAVVGIQLGYCVSDIVAKCGVGLLVYQITIAKSKLLRGSSGERLVGGAASYGTLK